LAQSVIPILIDVDTNKFAVDGTEETDIIAEQLGESPEDLAGFAM
jgi:hypothetical protein